MEGGKQYQQLVGSRRQVFNGTAKKTGYGKAALTKKHLKMNKHGRIVSVKKSRASRKNKNLGKFLQKRGSKTFGPLLAKKKGGDGDDKITNEADWYKAAAEDGTIKGSTWKDYDEGKTDPDWLIPHITAYIKEVLAKEEDGISADQAKAEITEKNAEEVKAQQDALEQKATAARDEQKNAAQELQAMADDAAKKAEEAAAAAAGGKKKAKKSKN